MTIEENRALVRRYFEDAPGDPRVCDEIFAPCLRFRTLQRASLTPHVVESTPQSETAAYELSRPEAQLSCVWQACVFLQRSATQIGA